MKVLLIHHELEGNRAETPSDPEYNSDDSDWEDETEEREEDVHEFSGIALCVGVGSFQDPDYKIEGLAHFVGEQQTRPGHFHFYHCKAKLKVTKNSDRQW